MIQSAEFSLTSDTVQEVDLTSYNGGTITILPVGTDIYFSFNCADSTEAATVLAATTGTFGVKNRVRVVDKTSFTVPYEGVRLLHFKRATATTVAVFVILNQASKKA